MKKIEMIVEKTNTGYSAYAKAYAIATVGSDMNELNENMIEAVNLHFEGLKVKKAITLQDLKITLDLEQFFDYYDVINVAALGKRIGMNKTLISQYIHGRKKPSEKQVEKILAGIKGLGKELAQIEIAV